jgi:hypothetical protein
VNYPQARHQAENATEASVVYVTAEGFDVCTIFEFCTDDTLTYAQMAWCSVHSDQQNVENMQSAMEWRDRFESNNVRRPG